MDMAGGNDGAPHSGVTFAPGQVGQAFSFDGQRAGINVPDAENLRITDALTISAWIRIAAFPQGHHGMIFFRGDDRFGLDPYYLSTEADGTVDFHVESLTKAADLKAPVAAGRFVHVVATFDSAMGLMRIYLDGVPAAQTSTAVVPFRDLDPNANPSCAIGNHGGFPTSPHNHPFQGLIDELQIYHGALSASEVQALFSSGAAHRSAVASQSQLVLFPNPVLGGQPALGQVTLAQPAGAGGEVVSLTSSNPAAAVVPASVTVPADADTLAFPITTFPVATTTAVTIGAAGPFGAASAILQVAAPGPPPPPVNGAVTAPVYDPANGHWYQLVRGSHPLTWLQANAAATALSYAGDPGHLATVTSAAENQFVTSYLEMLASPNPAWIGGYQDTTAPDYHEPDGGWRWVTGEPWSYTSWHAGEPSNSGGAENHLETYNDGTWNDTDLAATDSYLVEYEPPIRPALTIAVSPLPAPAAPAGGSLMATGRVMLAQPAGPGGVTILLSSDHANAIAVPASLFIPAGESAATFPVTIYPVAVDTMVTLAAYAPVGGATVTIPLIGVGLPLPQANRAVSPPVFNPANGHWYQLVRAPSALTWVQANAAAMALSYASFPGHLATVTSAGENQFITGYLEMLASPNPAWIGGYQDTTAPDYHEPDGGWRWVTGEPWSYTSWHAGEPSNSGGAENHLETYNDGTWNDTDLAATDSYLVEYEPALPPPAAGSTQFLLFPNPVPGGLLALGQVILPQPAGPGGEVVSLSSSNPAAAVAPASTTVLPGAGTATFPIVTFAVSQPVAVTITAGGAFGAARSVLQVLPIGSPTPAPTTTNLLVNGSFEEPPGGDRFGVSDGVPGWRIVSGDIDIVTNSYWQAAPDGGNQSIDLDGFHVGTIEQSFPTVPGQDYLFAGYVSHNPSVPYGRANVFLNGVFFTQLAHEIPNRNPDMQWQPFSFRFRATAPETTLTISDVTGINTSQGTVLDGLSVTLAPEQNPPVVTPGAPAAPTGLMVRATSANQVALAWTDPPAPRVPGPGETAVAVWRKGGGADWARIGALAARTTSFTDSGLAPGTSYTYRVRAINGAANVASDWSNEVTVTTPGGS